MKTSYPSEEEDSRKEHIVDSQDIPMKDHPSEGSSIPDDLSEVGALLINQT